MHASPAGNFRPGPEAKGPFFGAKSAIVVKFHRVAADGNAVLTERTDAIIIGPFRLQFWVCGVFEVHGGKITLWRDYFDAFDFFVKAPLRGLAGIFVPSLRPKM